MTKQINRLLKFGDFTIDPNERMLRHCGVIVSVSPKVFDLLFLFATHPGLLLDKETLMSELWGDHFVEESNLSYSLSVLRKALHEHDPSQKYIETFPKRGYRFLCEVTTVDPVEPEIIAPAPVHESINNAFHLSEAIPTPSRASSFRKYWRIGIIAAGLFLVSGAIWISTMRKENSEPKIASSVAPHPTTVAAIKSIAVLPFRKLTPSDGDDYLGVGIADTLINRLSQLRELQVRPISSVLPYTASSHDALSAGRDQKVEAVIEGTVQHIGQQLRVGVRLLRVSDGLVLWSETYNFAWTDLFTTQDAIADHIAKTMAGKYGENEQKQSVEQYREH